MNEEQFKKCMSYFATGITIVTTAINNNSNITNDNSPGSNANSANNNTANIITRPADSNKIFSHPKAEVREKEGLFGITVNSFNSVSLNPPMILYSLEKNTARFNIFYQAEKFFINILGQEQKIVSSTFSYNNFEAWQKYFLSTAEPAGRIENAICSLYCQTKYRYEGGDHIIIVADVKDFYLNNKSKGPNNNRAPEAYAENIGARNNYRKPDLIAETPDKLEPLVYYQGRYHKIGEKL